MAILIVTYDLRSPRDYTPFFNALRLIGPWWHYLTSTWLVETNKTSQQAFEALHPHMDPLDLILIAELSPNPPHGWLPKDAWEWVNSRLQRQRQGSFQFTSPDALAALNPPFHKTE
jgi:hypothetical protein